MGKVDSTSHVFPADSSLLRFSVLQFACVLCSTYCHPIMLCCYYPNARCRQIRSSRADFLPSARMGLVPESTTRPGSHRKGGSRGGSTTAASNAGDQGFHRNGPNGANDQSETQDEDVSNALGSSII